MSQTIDILEHLVAFPSVSADRNLDIIAYIQDFLTTRGFTLHRIAGTTGQKAGLFASIGPPGAGVLLSAHTDVVPVAGQSWTRAPFAMTREADRLYGRGTTDMKGFLACTLALADRAARADLTEPLKLSLSYDEEIGCVGIRQMIGQLAPTIGLPRAVIVGEPTGMQVAIGHKGKTALRAICHGQAGHSALAPNFVNALHVAADFINKIRTLQDDLAMNGAQDPAYDIPYSTLHAGKLTGGSALNIVPDRAVIDFELRHLPADDPGAILARLAAPRIEIEQINAYPGLDLAAADAGFALPLAQSQITKVPFGTEAGYFAAMGIPTVVCGPGDMQGQGHKPDEYIEAAQLAACDAMMDRLLAQLTA